MSEFVFWTWIPRVWCQSLCLELGFLEFDVRVCVLSLDSCNLMLEFVFFFPIFCFELGFLQFYVRVCDFLKLCFELGFLQLQVSSFCKPKDSVGGWSWHNPYYNVFLFLMQICEAFFSSHEELVSSSEIRKKALFFFIKVLDDGKEEEAQTQNPKLRSKQQLEYIYIFELQNNTTKGFIYLFIYIIIILFNKFFDVKKLVIFPPKKLVKFILGKKKIPVIMWHPVVEFDPHGSSANTFCYPLHHKSSQFHPSKASFNLHDQIFIHL